MRRIPWSAYELAQRYVGLKEVPGADDNPAIMAMLKLDSGWPEHDEVPWCSAFVNWVAHQMRLPRSKHLRARSWLQVGEPIMIQDAEPGFDVVILKRGGGEQPGPEVLEAPGHVGFFGFWAGGRIDVLSGNQGNSVSIASFKAENLLGIRRLA